MRLRRMLALSLAIVPDLPGSCGPVAACRGIRSSDYGRLSNPG
jgi:hypothetical protein